MKHVLTLFCELQQTIVSKVATNNLYKAFFDTIYKRFPYLASVYIDTKDLIPRSHCVYRDFLKGKMFRCYIKVPFSPIPLLPEKRLYSSSGTIFVLYPMRNDLLRFTFHRSCTVFRDCSYD